MTARINTPGNWLSQNRLTLATHGVALLLGIVTWWAIRPNRGGDQTEEVASINAHSGRQLSNSASTSEWVDAKIKQHENDSDISSYTPDWEKYNSMQEWLAANRVQAQEDLKYHEEFLDEIINDAAKLRTPDDPQAELRELLRKGEDWHQMNVLFQNWLTSDPDAAVQEVMTNLDLMEDEDVASLLEHNFGRPWVLDQMSNPASPRLFRDNLAYTLGTTIAMSRDIDDLLEVYNSAPDQAVGHRVLIGFLGYYEIDDPKRVASSLANKASPAVQSYFLDEWGNNDPFSGSVYGDNPWHNQWLTEVYQLLGRKPPENNQSNIDQVLSSALQNRDNAEKETVTFKQILADSSETYTSDNGYALKNAISNGLTKIFDKGPDYMNMLAEGIITRDELMTHITNEMPGMADYPDALEKELWEKSFWIMDVDDLTRWADDMPDNQKLYSKLIYEYYSSSNYDEPRARRRLEQLYLLSNEINDATQKEKIITGLGSHLESWEELSPHAANAWIDMHPHNLIIRKDPEKPNSKGTER